MSDVIEKEYVFIVQNESKGSYRCGYCLTDSEYVEKTRLLREKGYFLLRSFRVRTSDSLPVLAVCTDFVEGSVQGRNGNSPLDTLDDIIDEINEELGFKIERVA